MGTQIVSRELPSTNSPYQNILINGGFENWSGGSIFSGVGSNVPIANGWLAYHDGSAQDTISQESSTVKYGTYSLKHNCTSVGSATFNLVYQPVLGIVPNVPYSISVWINTTLANVTVSMTSGPFIGQSSAHPGDGTWRLLTATGTPASNSLTVQIGQQTGVSTGIFYVDSAMLASGSNPVTFVPDLPNIVVLQTADNNLAKNILINGGMDFWQRGTSFSAPALNAYVADRWKVQTNDAADAAVSQETSITDNSASSMKVIISGSPASKNWYLAQFVENYKDYAGKTISVSARVKGSVANACRLFLNDGVTSSEGSFHSGSGNFETISASINISTSASTLLISVGFPDNGTMQNGTYYFDSVMAVIGSNPVPFVPTSSQVELAQCQRYFWRSYNEYLGSGLCTSTTQTNFVLRYPVPMRAGPGLTVTGGTSFTVINATGGGVGTTSVTGSGLGTQSCLITLNVAAGLVGGNACYGYTSSAGYLEFAAEL